MCSLSLLQGILLTQGSNTGLPHLGVDSLPAEPQGKTHNTGVGSLSLLQGIFLTQESNQALLHCRRILYQLSYQGSQLSAEDMAYASLILKSWKQKKVKLIHNITSHEC